MTEIKAGPELDKAVADAIGLKTGSTWEDVIQTQFVIHFGEWRELRGGEDMVASPSLHVPFQPSTDLNAAFTVAEKVGLFQGQEITLSHDEKGGFYDGKWLIQKRLGLRDGEVWSAQPTPALAICAAILKLKEVK